jgi:hypothetical protein
MSSGTLRVKAPVALSTLGREALVKTFGAGTVGGVSIANAGERGVKFSRSINVAARNLESRFGRFEIILRIILVH